MMPSFQFRCSCNPAGPPQRFAAGSDTLGYSVTPEWRCPHLPQPGQEAKTTQNVRPLAEHLLPRVLNCPQQDWIVPYIPANSAFQCPSLTRTTVPLRASYDSMKFTSVFCWLGTEPLRRPHLDVSR